MGEARMSFRGGGRFHGRRVRLPGGAGGAAVKEIALGWTGYPARRPLRAGAADRAAWRATARTSSLAVIQAACSCRIMSGQCDRKIGPVEGPAQVSDTSSWPPQGRTAL